MAWGLGDGVDGDRAGSKTSNCRPFHIVLIFIQCEFITYLESIIRMGGQSAIRAYVNSKEGSRSASSEKPGKDKKSQGAPRADGSRREEHSMSGRPPGARQPQERWARVTRTGQSSPQWSGRRSQASGGHPRREDGLTVRQKPNPGQVLPVRRKTKR